MENNLLRNIRLWVHKREKSGVASMPLMVVKWAVRQGALSQHHQRKDGTEVTLQVCPLVLEC